MDWVEDFVIMGEIGVDIGDILVVVYESFEGELIGVGWFLEYNGKIGFYFVVYLEYEGMGFGGEIVNCMLSYILKCFEEDFFFIFIVYVVNFEVMEMLFWCGMYVFLDCCDLDILSDECVDMSMVLLYFVFFELVMKIFFEKYFDVL